MCCFLVFITLNVLINSVVDATAYELLVFAYFVPSPAQHYILSVSNISTTFNLLFLCDLENCNQFMMHIKTLTNLLVWRSHRSREEGGVKLIILVFAGLWLVTWKNVDLFLVGGALRLTDSWSCASPFSGELYDKLMEGRK